MRHFQFSLRTLLIASTLLGPIMAHLIPIVPSIITAITAPQRPLDVDNDYDGPVGDVWIDLGFPPPWREWPEPPFTQD